MSGGPLRKDAGADRGQPLQDEAVAVRCLPHHRAEPTDFSGWDHPSPYQLGGHEAQVFAAGSWGGEWHPDFVPEPGDVMIKEHWGSSGFANTDLDVQLKQRGVQKFPVALPRLLQHHPGMIRDKSAKKSVKEPAKLPKGVIAVAPPSFRRERALLKRGIWPVAGCDEAGRGPLAGPVVAAAVVLDPDRIPKGIDDSKRLTAEKREELFEKICATSAFAVAFASPARRPT